MNKIKIPLPKYVVIFLPFVLLFLSLKYINLPGYYALLNIIFLILPFVILFNDKILYYGELTDEESAEKQEKKEKEIGKFHYDKEKFIYYGNSDNIIEIEWNKIYEVYGIVVDTVYWDTQKIIIVTVDSKEFNITEDIVGWFVFVDNMKVHLHIPDMYLRLMALNDKLALLWKREINGKMNE